MDMISQSDMELNMRQRSSSTGSRPSLSGFSFMNNGQQPQQSPSNNMMNNQQMNFPSSSSSSRNSFNQQPQDLLGDSFDFVNDALKATKK